MIFEFYYSPAKAGGNSKDGGNSKARGNSCRRQFIEE